jgi:hypothetical protein
MIPDRPVNCPIQNAATTREVVQHLMTGSYRPLIQEYKALLEEDPDYLDFHFASAALRVQFALKLNDLPSLQIGLCNGSPTHRCCVLEALVEAVSRCSKERSAGGRGRAPDLSQSNHYGIPLSAGREARQ